MRFIKTLLVLLLLWPSSAMASRDLSSTNYMDGGTAANTSFSSSPFTVAGMVKLDSITGSFQTLIFRGVTALNNGWDLRVSATTGALCFFNYETDSACGTATTAPAAGTWYLVGAIVTGTNGSGTVKFVRYTPSTGTLATEDIGMFVAPSPAGTFKLLIGGRWNGALVNLSTGDFARFGVWAGDALTTTQLITWACTGVAAAGGDGLWELAGSASPETDSSGNSYSLTLSGTAAGSALDTCPIAGVRGPLLGVYP